MTHPTLEAGPELDALVAEKVMGWTWGVYQATNPATNWIGPRSRVLLQPDVEYGHLWEREYWPDDPTAPQAKHLGTPDYSEDIAAAWLVVEKIKTDKLSAELWAPKGDPHWVCRFYDMAGRIIGADGADTAPLAICLAALKVAAASPGETSTAFPDSVERRFDAPISFG